MQALSRHSETSYLPLGLRRGAPDLPQFALDLHWAKKEYDSAARPRTYPSPPMSGSPSLPPISSQGVGDRSQRAYHTATSQDARAGMQSTHGDFGSPHPQRFQPQIYHPHPHPHPHPHAHHHHQAQAPAPAPGPVSAQAQAHMGSYQHESFDRARYSLQRPPAPESLHRPEPFQAHAASSMIPPHSYLPHSSTGLGPGSLSNFGPPPSLSGLPQSSYSNPPRPPQEPQSYASPKTQRKTKGHVASACVPCKKAHLRCDSQRPCSRCTSNGKEDCCVDVQHKKRGRPRLRDDREVRYDVSGRHGPSLEGSGLRRPMSLYSSQAPAQSHSSYDDSMRRSQSYRVLKSLPSEASSAPRYLERASAADANIYPAPLSIAPRNQEAVAYLTTDFEVAKTSAGFLDTIGRHSIKGLGLFDVVVQSDRERVMGLQAQLQDEQRRKEPSYLPPMFAKQEEERVFHGLGFGAEDIARFSLDRQALLTFSGQEGQSRTCTVRLGLAKMESIFFVVVQLNSGVRTHGHLTPSPHPRDPRDSPFQYSSPHAHYPAQPPQPTPVSATFSSVRPRLGSDASVYGVRSQGAGAQMMPTHSPGMSSSSYSASPSRTEYQAGVASFQIPRSELPPSTRPALPQQPTYQLPPIRNQQPQSSAAAPPLPESSSWPRDDRLKVGGLIDNPDPFTQQRKPR